jgi:hypothetical protein
MTKLELANAILAAAKKPILIEPPLGAPHRTAKMQKLSQEIEDTIDDYNRCEDCHQVIDSDSDSDTNAIEASRTRRLHVTVHGLARRRGSLLGRERTEPETGKQRVARI